MTSSTSGRRPRCGQWRVEARPPRRSENRLTGGRWGGLTRESELAHGRAWTQPLPEAGPSTGCTALGAAVRGSLHGQRSPTALHAQASLARPPGRGPRSPCLPLSRCNSSPDPIRLLPLPGTRRPQRCPQANPAAGRLLAAPPAPGELPGPAPPEGLLVGVAGGDGPPASGCPWEGEDSTSLCHEEKLQPRVSALPPGGRPRQCGVAGETKAAEIEEGVFSLERECKSHTCGTRGSCIDLLSRQSQGFHAHPSVDCWLCFPSPAGRRLFHGGSPGSPRAPTGGAGQQQGTRSEGLGMGRRPEFKSSGTTGTASSPRRAGS